MVEGNVASVGGGSEAAVAAPVAAPAPIAPAQAAPLEPNSGSYLDRMQAAVAVVDAGEQSLESQAAEVAASVSETAPDSGAETTDVPAEQTAEAETQGEPSETPTETQPAETKAPVIPYEQLPDNMRAELRKSNLAPEIKEALAQSWYERKAYHDVGFTVDQARQLKAVGFTPEAANDRLRMHPTVEDAQVDANLANIARTLINDFQTNPSAMIDGLKSNAPEAFPGFVESVASQLKTVAPKVYGGLVSQAMQNALDILDSEYPSEDFETKEKIAFVRNKFFPQVEGEPRRDPGAFNPNDPIHVKYQQQQQAQQAQYVAQAQEFERAVTTYGQQTVAEEVQRRVASAMPPGTDPEIVNRAAGEIIQRVSRDFFGNRGMMDNISRMMRNADLSQEALDNIVNQIYNRAIPLVAVHSKPVLEFWSKTARAPEPPKQPAVKAPSVSSNSSRTVANAPSAARIAAASPQPAMSTTPPKEFIASGRKQGWDTGKIISAWLSGQK